MTDSHTDVSIVLCTWNNSSQLKLTLQSIAQCAVPRGLSWEIVVVDNNSQDDTPSVVSHFGTLPILYVLEPRRGLSHARNRGVAEASGQLIIFTDDDVRPCTAWIETYWTAFCQNPKGQFWGGPIESEFIGGDPDPELVRLGPPSIKGLDLGEEKRLLTGATVPLVSANWACPKAAMIRCGGFDPRFGLNAGPSGTSVGEETKLMERLISLGMTPWYLPGACLRHIVPCGKVSVSHLATRRHAYGQYLGETLDIGRTLPLLRLPPWVIRELCRRSLSWLRVRVAGASGTSEYLAMLEIFGAARALRRRSVSG